VMDGRSGWEGEEHNPIEAGKRGCNRGFSEGNWEGNNI
jgi:heat shock protein HslJ